MWLVDLNCIFKCELIELSDNKLSNNKLSNNKLSDNNLASELVKNRTFFKPITSEKIVIFMISSKNGKIVPYHGSARIPRLTVSVPHYGSWRDMRPAILQGSMCQNDKCE